MKQVQIQVDDPRTVRTETLLFDGDGHRVHNTADMVSGERIEYDKDDNVVRRSYLTNQPPSPTFGDVDAFDVMLSGKAGPWNLEVDGQPVTTIAALFTYLIGDDKLTPSQVRTRVANILLLPAWANAPADLRAAVDAYLSA